MKASKHFWKVSVAVFVLPTRVSRDTWDPRAESSYCNCRTKMLQWWNMANRHTVSATTKFPNLHLTSMVFTFLTWTKSASFTATNLWLRANSKMWQNCQFRTKIWRLHYWIVWHVISLKGLLSMGPGSYRWSWAVINRSQCTHCRSCCVQDGRTRSAKIIWETCLGLMVVKDLQSLVNWGWHVLLDGWHEWAKTLQPVLLDCWVEVWSLVFVGTAGLRISVFYRDIGFFTRLQGKIGVKYRH